MATNTNKSMTDIPLFMKIERHQRDLRQEAWHIGIFCLMLWLSAACGWPAHAAAGTLPSVAIISDPGLREAGSLATAALGQSEKFTLVERDDIDKIMREHLLSAATLVKSGALQLGHLLKADSVLLIQKQKLEKGTVLALRLIAVNSGVVVWSAYYPPESPEKWRDAVKERVERMLPKLRTSAIEAVPISVVAVRSASKHPHGLETERDLRSLLIHRLAHEPALFVLERQRLEDLAREKQFDPEPEKFWTGRYLLDVQFHPSKENPAELELDAQLTPPGTKQPIALSCRGSSKNLEVLATDLARKVAQAVGKTPTELPWGAVEEARQFLEAANWINQASPVASDGWLEATDAAWALGLRNDRIACFRIARLLSDKTKPQDFFQALEFATERAFSPASGPLSVYDNVGLAAIERVCENPPQFDSPEDNAQLRRLLRNLLAVLDEGHRARKGRTLFIKRRAPFIPIWSDSQQDIIASYRALLKNGSLPALERFQLREALPSDVFAPSSSEDNGPWSDFHKEIASSTNVEDQLARLHRRLTSADNDEQIALHKELLARVWAIHERIGRGEISHEYLSYPLSLYSLAKSIGYKEFKLNVLVAFCRQPDVDPGSLYEAYRIYTNERYPLTLAEATELHSALLEAQKTKHKGMNGEFTDNKVVQYAMDLETEFPTLSRAPQKEEIPPNALTVSRISVLRLQKKSPRTFTAHYGSARWHGGRLWLIARIDDKWGILNLDVETNDAQFIRIPSNEGNGAFDDDQMVVTEDAVFVARNYRRAPKKAGLLRYDRKSGTWRTYNNVYGLNSNYEPDLVTLGGFLYSTYYFEDMSALSSPSGLLRIDTASGQMEVLTNALRRPQKSPLDDPDYHIWGMFAGSDGLLYVKASKSWDEGRSPMCVFSYSPKTGEWKELLPTERTAALPLNVDVPVLSAFGDFVYNWPGAGIEYWSDDRESWHGQPTRALKYGDLQINGIITIPLHFAPDLKKIRRLSNPGDISDSQLQRNIVQQANAWLITPKGVLFTGGEFYWYFVSAEEVRAAARKLAAGPGPKAPFWDIRKKVLSPDQKSIAFVSERDGNPDIFIANADGSGAINLTNSWAQDGSPSFSPDGKQIFYRTRHPDQSGTNCIDIATRVVRRVPQ